MQVNLYTARNNYNNYSSINKCSSRVSFGNVTKLECSAAVRLNEFIRRGYQLINKEVEVFTPERQSIKGAAFIKNNLNQEKYYNKGVDLILTDDKYVALGEVHSAEVILHNSIFIMQCSLRNYTNKYNLSADFLEPEFEAAEYSKTGKFGKVGTGLYDNLAKFLKDNYPKYYSLYASIRSQESWDFHTRYGFTMDIKGKKKPTIDDYDTYCPASNHLFYRLK